jgi:hypothetical protein
LLFTLISCKKDEDKNKFRIVSEEFIDNGDSYGESTYEYMDNTISRYYYEEDQDYSAEAIFDYSEENKIVINTTENDAGDESESEIKITLSGGNITEFFEEGDHKEVYTYNESDQLVKAKEYDDSGNGLVLYKTTTFTYDGGKLVESLEKYEDTESQYKSEYAYDSDGYLEEEISYYNSNSEWVEENKDVYSYTTGRVSEINYYYFDLDHWVKDNWHEEFVYDENGNLVESTEFDENNDEEWTTKYTYEEGSGNYNQIFGSYYAMGSDYIFYPLPTKSARRDMDISGSKDRINLYRSLDNKHNPAELFRPQRNRQ